MDSYKVLITTSGIGSRLGEFTRFTNKSLLRIGEKPAISYIIESYPPEVTFVITLGYFGDQVKDFLEIAYPDKEFEFVTVSNYNGEGSSLLFSLFHAKDYLQEPFIFHASDTIILDKIPAPQYNWNAGYKGSGSSSYASFDVLGDTVKIMYDKGNLNPDYLHVGLLGINDFASFWKYVEETLIDQNYSFTLGDVDVLKKMIYTSSFTLVKVRDWYDIGNVDKMNEAKAQLDSGKIHVLDKLGESIFHINNSIVKFFYDKTICANRAKRTEYLKDVVPSITASKLNFYKYSYIDGTLFSNIVNRKSFPLLLEWAEKNLWLKTETISRERFKDICYNFYYTKTIARLKEFHTSRILEDDENIINDESIPKIDEMLKSIDMDYLCNTEPTLFHGDFILDNIIYQGDGNFKLIDWRQDFGGELVAGDKYYDLGKLAHNLVVNHELIDQNFFTVTKQNDNISLNIHRLQTLVDSEKVLFDLLDAKGYDIKKVKILRAIIWLNMSPLHHHPFDLFLYYYGKYSLFQAIQ